MHYSAVLCNSMQNHTDLWKAVDLVKRPIPLNTFFLTFKNFKRYFIDFINLGSRKPKRQAYNFCKAKPTRTRKNSFSKKKAFSLKKKL